MLSRDSPWPTMIRIALNLLVGDRSKFLGMVIGVAFASLLITQQAAIFRGVMALTYGLVTDSPNVDIWVGDPGMPQLDTADQLNPRSLDLTRGVADVAWAVPMNRRLIQARTAAEVIEPCMVVGVDDATLIGAPTADRMIEGSVAGLRTPRGVIVDAHAAASKLRITTPDGGWRPMRVGDRLRLGGSDTTVVGICRSTLSLMLYPTIYTRRSLSARLDAPTGRGATFILAGLEPGADPQAVCAGIDAATGLTARTAEDVSRLTYHYFLTQTGIPANFGIAVLLGFVVGAAIAGQAFHQFVVDNRRTFASLKAMGMRDGRLAGILLVQALAVTLIGYGLGVGVATLFGSLLDGTDLSFRLEPALLVLTLGSALAISIGSALLSLRGLLRLDPALVFRS